LPEEEVEELLDELEATRSERDDLAAQVHKLNYQIMTLKSQADKLNAAIKKAAEDQSSLNRKHTAEKRALQKQILQLKEVIEEEIEEPLVLRDRLDQATFKLRKAERRNRYVDDADRWKADAKYRKKKNDAGALLVGFPTYEADEYKESVLKERRGVHGLVAKSAEEVVNMMTLFNHSVFQTAARLSPLIVLRGARYAAAATGPSERAKKVLGARAFALVVDRLPVLRKLNPLLPQMLLQMFLAFWCNSIIEAWYPKQATFAEFLVDVCTKLKVGDSAGVSGLKTVITQSHTRSSVNLFGEWAQDIVDDLHEILSAFGWVITGYDARAVGMRGTAFHGAIVNLVKEAYDLRTAMAEVSTSGDVDLAIISFDTPFNPKRMKDEYADERESGKGGKINSDADDGGSIGSKGRQAVVERVVGTTGIGLQREVMRPHVAGMMKRDIQMVLKPQVVLEKSVVEALVSDA